MENAGSSGNRPVRKTSSKWNSFGSRRPKIDEALVFYPTIEEFEDAMGYIAKIRPQAELHGICKIVPPSSWVPPCPLKENKDLWENAKFPTTIQQIHLLQNRESLRKKKQKRGRPSKTSDDVASKLEDESFGPFEFQSGPDFTLKEFQQHADAFKGSYFKFKNYAHGDGESSGNNHQNKLELSVEEIEGEYWRIIEKPTNAVEVYYGNDVGSLDSLESGFPKAASSLTNKSDLDLYAASGWNLNNVAQLPGSALCFEGNDIPGVIVPWLYVGMCFSTFCWHVEDHHLNSLHYLHWGDPIVWYGVPGSHATALEEAVKKQLPGLFEKQPDLLNELVTQFTPSILQGEGVPVYRTVQNAGEFLLTFPRAYHGSFSCGFNCAESVNVAPADWFPHGQVAVELYSQQCRKTSLSHDKVLLGSAEDALLALADKILHGKESLRYLRWRNACGEGGVLTEAVKTRMVMEKERLLSLPIHLKMLRMDKSFDSTERECIFCLYDLHQSAVGCTCSPNRFSCLEHSDKICNCTMDQKVLLCRYTMTELSELVIALKGEEQVIAARAKRNSSNHYKGLQLQRCLDSRVHEMGHVGISKETSLRKFRCLIETFYEAVELVRLGSVVFGKLWCSKHAIYPKGFKSRVQFFSIFDPANICDYVTEVIDGGLLGPLFRVTMEGNPNQTFTQTSADKCWETVIEKLIPEIKRRQSLGEEALPPLELLHTVKGHGMFGFLSPSIIQCIEVLDPGHQCAEYWSHKDA